MPRWLLVAMGIGAAAGGSILAFVAVTFLIVPGLSAGAISICMLLGFVLWTGAVFVAYRIRNP